MSRQSTRWTLWTSLLLTLALTTACGLDPTTDAPDPSLKTSKQAYTLIYKKNLFSPVLPKICTLNKQCKSTEYCKKSACASISGVCTTRPKSCVFTTKSPVKGCNGVNYYNACYAGLAGQNVYKQLWVSRMDENLCNGSVARFGYADYPRYSMIGPAPGEYGHYAATTFAPSFGQTPYKVSKISYDLINATVPGAPLHDRPLDTMCNAGLGHRVLLFVVPANSPPVASPVVLRTIQVNQTSANVVPGNNKTRTFTHSFSPITLQAGEKLVVAIEMSGVSEDNLMCLGQCYDPNLTPREFWSFSTHAPFNWQPSSVWRGERDGFRVRVYASY